MSSSQNLVMPANGDNKNVMCFIDAIYVYLRARADDADRARAAGEACGEARGIHQGRGRMHGLIGDGRVMGVLKIAFGSRRIGFIACQGIALRAGRAMPSPRARGIRELVDPKTFRVCADPRNLPFSNEAGKGFEYKLAELFAQQTRRASQLHLLSTGVRLRAQHAECAAL